MATCAPVCLATLDSTASLVSICTGHGKPFNKISTIPPDEIGRGRGRDKERGRWVSFRIREGVWCSMNGDHAFQKRCLKTMVINWF